MANYRDTDLNKLYYISNTLKDLTKQLNYYYRKFYTIL